MKAPIDNTPHGKLLSGVLAVATVIAVAVLVGMLKVFALLGWL